MSKENVESETRTKPIEVEISIKGQTMEQLLYAQAVIVPQIEEVLGRFRDVLVEV